MHVLNSDANYAIVESGKYSILIFLGLTQLDEGLGLSKLHNIPEVRNF